MRNRRLRSRVSSAVVTCVVGLALSLGACVPTTMGPDGQVVQHEPDYQSVRLIASASVAAWAAAQKDGIKPDDAKALVGILESVNEYRLEGGAIVPEQWAPVVKRDVPVRYQALAMVIIQLTAHELEKYDLNPNVPIRDPRLGKILEAIYEGAKLGLTPYLMGMEEQEDRRALYGAYHRA